MKMKRSVSLLLAIVLLLSLFACGSGSGTQGGGEVADGKQTAEDNGIPTMEDYPFDSSRTSTANSDGRYPFVEFAQSMSPTEWQPYNLADAAKSYGKWLVYEFLVDRVGANDYAPRLAKTWTQEDGTHYTFELYDNIKDSAGNAVKASDVVFSYDLNAASGYAEKFDKYASAEAVGDYTVRFTLSAPIDTLDGFYYLFANVAIVSEASYDELGFSRAPIGTGPYALTDFVTDSYCTFEARDDYWQTGELRSDLAKTNVQTLRVDFVTDSSRRMIMLENGTSFANPYLVETDIDKFLEGGEFADKFNMTAYNSTQSGTLLANMSEDSIMSDINMRLACWYAIDSKALVVGLGAIGNSACIVDAAPSIGDYLDEWNSIESYQTEYSTEKAKEYLEKAGYKGETVKILAGTFGTKKNTAQIVAEMLRQVGINTDLTVVEYTLEEQTLHDSKGWDLYTTSQIDNDYTINRLYNCYSINAQWAANGLNKAFLYDPVLEGMINSCNSPDNYDVEKAGDVLQYVIDNAYGYATVYANNFVAWNLDIARPTSYYGHPEYPLWNACDFYLD